MFCMKCGNKLADGDLFCSSCGTKVGETGAKPANTVIDWNGLKNKVNPEGITGGFRAVEDCKWMYIGAILTLLVSLFMLGSEMIQVSYQALWVEDTIKLSMFEDREFLKTLFVLGYIAAIVALLLPPVLKRSWENGFFFVAVGVSALAVFVLLCVMLGAKNEISENYLTQAVDAKAALTGNGWLFILFNAASVILTFKTGFAIGDWQENHPDGVSEYQAKTYVRPYWCVNCGATGPFENGCPACGSRSKVYMKPAYAKTIEAAMKAQQEKLAEQKLLEEKKAEIQQAQEALQDNVNAMEEELPAQPVAQIPVLLQETATVQAPPQENRERQTVRVYAVKEKKPQQGNTGISE